MTSEQMLKTFYGYMGLDFKFMDSGRLGFPSNDFKEFSPFIISKSAPGTSDLRVSTHPDVMSFQALSLIREGIFDSMSTYLTGSEMGARFLFFIRRLSTVPLGKKNFIPPNRGDLGPLTNPGSFIELVSAKSVKYFCGRLGIKIEPAGKVRVFAMVDCFTQ